MATSSTFAPFMEPSWRLHGTRPPFSDDSRNSPFPATSPRRGHAPPGAHLRAAPELWTAFHNTTPITGESPCPRPGPPFFMDSQNSLFSPSGHPPEAPFILTEETFGPFRRKQQNTTRANPLHSLKVTFRKEANNGITTPQDATFSSELRQTSV